ncbi:MAG: (5-formylfuran-3-yl)methyl phosphate synthase [Planctomycetaceae bacterium]
MACAGRCDILDVKEPSRGALGMAAADVLAEIAHSVSGSPDAPPVSIALGELAEWPDNRPLPQLPAEIRFLKVGVAGLSPLKVAVQLARLQRRFADEWDQNRLQVQAAPPAWILATYADFTAAHSPFPGELWEIARNLGCTGVLIDTWAKQGPGLTSCLKEDELQILHSGAHELELSLALAGRLTLADIPLLRRVGAEIVGIRSAACAGGDRSGALCSGALEQFRIALSAPLPDTAPARTVLQEPLPMTSVNT